MSVDRADAALALAWLVNNPNEFQIVLSLARLDLQRGALQEPYRKGERCHQCPREVWAYREDGTPVCEEHGR